LIEEFMKVIMPENVIGVLAEKDLKTFVKEDE